MNPLASPVDRLAGLPDEPLTEAQWRLVVEHEPMVAWAYTRWFRKRYPDFEETILDAGWLGLVRAARFYDPARGIKFSTYLSRCLYLDMGRRAARAAAARHREIPASHRWTDADGRPGGNLEPAAREEDPTPSRAQLAVWTLRQVPLPPTHRDTFDLLLRHHTLTEAAAEAGVTRAAIGLRRDALVGWFRDHHPKACSAAMEILTGE